MATQTPASKRKRGGSPSPRTATASAPTSSGTTTTMGGYGALSLLSSVTKSVTKRMRLGYDYALGGGGTTTNGDSVNLNTGGAAGASGAAAGGTVRAHAHKSPVPRREFGSPQAAGGGGGVGGGGIGSPPFAAGPPAAAAGASAAASASAPASAGGGKKVGFTPFGDGKKAADGKLGGVSVVALVGTLCKHAHTRVVGIFSLLLFHIHDCRQACFMSN